MLVQQPTLAELASRHLSRASVADDSPEIVGDVEPYDVVTAFRTEPRTAWAETTLVLKLLGHSGPMPKMPTDWLSTVRSQPAAGLIPMAAGYYPQQVSDLGELLTLKAPNRPKRNRIVAGYDINDQATACWEAGDDAGAIHLWHQLPDSAVKAFNLGVANTSVGDAVVAVTHFQTAESLLPESSGWKHLATIYAEMLK